MIYCFSGSFFLYLTILSNVWSMKDKYTNTMLCLVFAKAKRTGNEKMVEKMLLFRAVACEYTVSGNEINDSATKYSQYFFFCLLLFFSTWVDWLGRVQYFKLCCILLYLWSEQTTNAISIQNDFTFDHKIRTADQPPPFSTNDRKHINILAINSVPKRNDSSVSILDHFSLVPKKSDRMVTYGISES